MIGSGEVLSYGQLYARVGRLARQLRELGTGPGTRVGVFLERSPDLVVGFLATLWVGGVYVPIDPSYPGERLSFLLADSGVAVILSRSDLAGRLPAGAPGILFMDGLEALAEPPEVGGLSPVGGPEDLLYVIYTSGSTGLPKGAGVYQRSFLNLLRWYVEEFGLSAADRFLILTSASFDLTQKNFFAPLLVGGLLVLADPGPYDSREIVATIERHEITRLNCTPSAFYPLIETGEPGRLSSLRSVFLGGEHIVTARLAPWRRSARGSAEVVNTYGPTECTDVVAFHRLATPEVAGPDSAPLGRPLPGVRLLVLDRRSSPVPVGVSGQLAVGGVGVGAGYLGSPELTALRFVPDPFASEPGARLYWTGDLVRTLAGGEIDFLGRVDHQVKVRGFRIELGEIEAVLGHHPLVREVVVVTREERPGDPRLVAYVVPRQELDGFPAVLRGYAGERLPAYLVPALFVMLSALPLSPNGKVDRAALPAPEWGRETVYLAPRMPIEEVLAGIWEAIFGVDQVGIADDFFSLGGHSLLATQMMSRVREAFEVELPLRALFDAPTVAGLAAQVELVLRGPAKAVIPPLRAAEERGVLPLSFAQERLWFLDQLDPGSAAYNIPVAVRLLGPLDQRVLAASLAEIVRRHEALRTTFVRVEDRPVQVIAPARLLAFPQVDLGSLSPENRASELTRLALAEAGRAFDLTRGPLLRATLVRLIEGEHALLFTLHHIVSDGWSIGVLIRELGALYGSWIEGQPSPLPELALQYPDFALWQRGYLTGEVLEGELAYWRETLSGLVTLDLPTDRPRLPVRQGRGAVVTFGLRAGLTGELKHLSRTGGSTLFMSLLAGFAALLSRSTGQDDIAVGTPIANRDRAEIEELIGFFVNTLVLRIGCPGDPAFGELLAAVRRTALGAYEHQSVPFERVVEELSPPRDPSRTPLFQVMFMFQNPERESLVLPGLTLEPVPALGETAKFDLTLSLGEGLAGLSGSWEYDRDLFEVATMARLSRHFESLLAGAVAERGSRLSELPLLSPPERHQLLWEWNGAAGEIGWGAALPELLAARSAADPGAPAVIGGGEVVTYGQLHARAGRIAWRLRELGVGPGTRVGLFLDRSPDLVVGLLATLLAGGAYVPLDPSYPAERLSFLGADSGAAVILSRSDLVGQLPAGGPAVLMVDRPGAEGDLSAVGTLSPIGGPEDLLYVIYTSGSTGLPKGAGVHQGGFLNLLRWYVGEFGLSAADRFLILTSASFDLTQKNFLAPLLVGGLLVLADPGPYDPQEIVATIEQHGITRLNCTPSAFYPLLESGGSERLASLRSVFLGGEPIAPARLAPWRRSAGCRAEVVNTYGPTECTDVVAFHRLLPPETERLDSVPVGRPISGLRLTVLDRRLSPVPLGVAGQLVIGGVGVGAGYLGRPELTAERFVPDPFAEEPGARLYWTGDLARTSASGEIDFLGRIDHQIKIRGFRIELGEIEAVLGRHPEVREVVVTTREASPGDHRLVAYVVPRQAAADLPATLRGDAAGQLPAYLVPTAFVVLAALPLTPSGKVDRVALPLPEWASDAAYVAPRTPVESELAGIWESVLGVERVGIADDFFTLGGHSLLATQAMSRVRKAFGVEVPLRAFFEAPTVAGLARVIATALAGSGGAAQPPLRSVERVGPLPLSFAQERLWFLDQLDPGSAVYNIPVALRLRGRLEVAVLEASLREIVCRHESLRTTFTTIEGAPVQVIAPAPRAVPLAIPRIDLGELPPGRRESELRELALAEASRPFDLTRGPLLRAALLRLTEGEQIALLTMHHIVSDGWSMDVLIRELSVLYSNGLAGQPSPLPEPGLQYADFAVWQRSYLAGEVLASELAYWREALAGLATLDLPTDRPRQPVRKGRGAICGFSLPEGLSGELKRQGQAGGMTLFMTLLAGFTALLSRYTGQGDVAVGTPVASRDRVEIEGLIGFFVNTLVLRISCPGDPAFGELLAAVRRTALSAYEHQGLPFERVVEELSPSRDPSRTPLFQVMFTLQSSGREGLVLPGLALEQVPAVGETAKFDLTLSLGEGLVGLAGSWEYDRDLFEAATIARLSRHFESLLVGAVAERGARLSELPLFSPAERHQLLWEWNGAAGEIGWGAALPELLAARAAVDPGAPAVIGGGEVVTYGQLHARAGRIAWRLRELGVAPGTRVGLFLARSPDLVVGLLATLLAGGAYVPLDPSYPAERLSFLCADSGAAVILSRSDLVGRLPDGGPAVLLLDHLGAERNLTAVGALSPVGGPEDLLYVIYTSGSTGLPKGSRVHQGSFLNLLRWYVGEFGLSAADRFLVLTSASFDLTQKNFLAPLLVGGLLVLADPGPYDPQEIVATVEQHGITRLNCTPSAFYPLLEAGGTEQLSSLRSVFLGGEPIAPARLAPWRRSAGCRAEVVNTYGPTECTDVVAFHRLVPPETAGPDSIPVGRPISGLRLTVLDPRLSPVPLGVAGQLAVGGVGVGAGYLGRPELTAERFVPDPFAAEPGARLYWTGDLARTSANGEVEFLGRIDHQIKIRGFRIELQEIEVALAGQPGIAEAAVLVEEKGTGDRKLVAYVVPLEATAGEPALAEGLRDELRRRLPDYMVPYRFIPLASLPLTPNGKIDRKALAALRAATPEEAQGVSAGSTAPRTPIEEILAGICAQLLGIERVGVDDNFFDLGGHSLLATRLAAHVQQTFGVALPLRRFFEAPTIAALAAQIGDARSVVGVPAPPLVPAARETALPLSFAQERLWFVDQFEPGEAAYNLPLVQRCQGDLDLGRLAASLREVVRRHESLRTTFTVAGGRAVQVIVPEIEIDLPLADLCALGLELRDPLAERLIAAEAWRPFDLATGPLLRALVLRLGPAEHALLLTMHHIVSDGWSKEVLIHEVATLYRAFWEGCPSPLPPLPVQYADFAVWQRQWLAGEVLEAQLGYWRERLAGAPPILDLPLDSPRPPVHTWNGTREWRPLPLESAERLAGLARRGQATLFMSLLAAWNVLLLRWTGQSDLSVGTPIAGRTHREVEGLIGFFANTLVLRTGLAGRPGFSEIVARVRETALGAFTHQDVPFEKLVGELVVERSLEHTPLFQVMFVLQQASSTGEEVSLPGVHLSPLNFESRTAKFDLTLMFQQSEVGLQAVLGYNTDLFRRDTVLRLLGQLEGLLAGMVAEPERPVVELPLLTLPERHQLLLGWNDTPVTADGDLSALCLHQHFEGWAARRPGAPAAVLDGDLLTYGDLDLRAGRLAARLRRLGVGPEVRVGLCLPRSFDLLTALLAVLKAGGAYVPLDPANPRDRLLFLLADSRVPVLLTVRGLAGELGGPLEPGAHSADSPTRVICLDEEPTEETGRDEMPAAKVGPDNLAYVIYTSGSTGTPNGVLVPHRGAVNLIREAASLYRVTPESRILQTASVGFDASVLEIFLALAHGASLCLVREEERLTPAVLADRLIEQKVTTAVVTPSLLSVLPEGRLRNLVAISVGGEACPAELAARWAPGRQFLNCYGPTEATIFATVAILSGREEKITIGRPVGNVLAYVVDRELLPLPIGAVGELVVGGVGLARGYLDRPEKTALKFVPDPLSGQAGERLYRTGDLARFTPAGEIEFLGRLDDQVKVRGFRIELGEIEAALLRHPGIQAAVVLAPADAQGERKLIAYTAGPAESRPTDAELRAFLAEHLPEYMVPVHLVLLDALPTTPGGKVDRRALPDPEGSRPEAGEHVEPRTAAERFVAGLWRQVLGIERVSATDDFFALGGNSIKGAILTNLLQEKLGEYVYVVALFDAPTLGALARYLEENYTEALERVTGEKVSSSGGGGGRVEPSMLVTLREVIPPLAPKTASAPKNRRAVFLLSPPRSGSTLLRVMLAGNPALFAPPELELLGFNTLAERKEALSGRWALWQEGTIRALMEVYGCDAEEARRRMDEAEARGLTVQQLYGELQEAIGGRLLVDKTPSYALDPATLARAEEDFRAPLYVHLLRHPYGMIRSFEKAKLEQVFFRPSHPFSRRQLAELIWDLSQENILDLLSRVPAERQIQLRFEEMLKAPEREMRRVCEFLGVPFDPGMLDPYADKAQRMTDGIHQLSKMVGDVKFHEHKGIEAQTADSWRREIAEDFLGDVTWDLAATLGYHERVAGPREPRPGFSALVPIQPQGTLPPLYLVHPVGGNVLCYAELSRRLGEDQPVYGLQALGLAPGAPGTPGAGTAPQETVEAMAASYVAAIRAAQPRGPYRLGGWSIGGVIAYEMAHQLRNAGEEVELLALFDSLAPVRSRGEESGFGSAGETAEPTAEPDDALLLAGLARDLGGLSGRPVAIAPAELAGLAPEAGLARVIERVRAAGALPAGLSAEQIGRLWRVFRANVRAVRAYTPRPAAGRTAIFVTLGNPERDSLGADLGWGRLVGGALAVSDLPGDHYSLLREPDVESLADALRRATYRVEAGAPLGPRASRW